MLNCLYWRFWALPPYNHFLDEWYCTQWVRLRLRALPLWLSAPFRSVEQTINSRESPSLPDGNTIHVTRKSDTHNYAHAGLQFLTARQSIPWSEVWSVISPRSISPQVHFLQVKAESEIIIGKNVSEHLQWNRLPSQ